MKFTLLQAGVQLTPAELRAAETATGFSGNTLERELVKVFRDAGANAIENLIERGRMRQKVDRMTEAGEIEVGRAVRDNTRRDARRDPVLPRIRRARGLE